MLAKTRRITKSGGYRIGLRPQLRVRDSTLILSLTSLNKGDNAVDPTHQDVGIPIVYEELETIEGGKGLGAAVERLVRRTGTLDITQLASNLELLCRQLGAAFQGVTTAVKDYEVQEFEVTVDVTAKGEIRLVGGISSEIKGGLKLVFRRTERAK